MGSDRKVGSIPRRKATIWIHRCHLERSAVAGCGAKPRSTETRWCGLGPRWCRSELHSTHPDWIPVSETISSRHTDSMDSRRG